MSELKPCPFCGGHDILQCQDGYVACNNDDCFIYYVETIIEVWNTRQSPKKMIAEGLGSMRRRGYFDGGLIIQDVAKRANLEIEEVQKFMTILLESCKEDN